MLGSPTRSIRCSIWADVHVVAAHRPAQRRLVHDHPVPRRVLPGQQLLPAQPQRHPALDFVRVDAGRALHDDGPRVLLRLQQAGHELDLVDPDELRGLLEADEDVEPVGHDVLELLVPRGRVGFLGQLEQLLPLGGVVHAVELEQVGDVAFLEGNAAELHPADLRAGGPDVVAGVVPRHPAVSRRRRSCAPSSILSTVGPPAGATPPGALPTNAVPSQVVQTAGDPQSPALTSPAQCICTRFLHSQPHMHAWTTL